MNNELPFKVKCIDIESHYTLYTLTVGKEYDVIETDDGLYKVINDVGNTRWYHDIRFEIVERESNPKDKQEFSVGDKVVINKISNDFVSLNDKNVKIGDVATVSMIENCSEYDVRLTNPNWKNGWWWFSKNDLSLVADGENHLTYQEAIQAILDGKEVEIQDADGAWHSMLPINTTLHQLTSLNFRLKPSLEEKRKAIIKKLLETKVAVLCKCWDDDDVDYNIDKVFVAVTSVDDGCTYPYTNHELTYQCAFAIDDNGNEITNV